MLVTPGGVEHLQSRTREQVHVGVVRCRFAPNVRSRIQVGKRRVAVDRAKRKTKHLIEELHWIEMQLPDSGQFDKKVLTNVSKTNNTYEDEGQDGERGRPKTCIHNKHGDTL